jgi:hypothetical protein
MLEEEENTILFSNTVTNSMEGEFGMNGFSSTK